MPSSGGDLSGCRVALASSRRKAPSGSGNIITQCFKLICWALVRWCRAVFQFGSSMEPVPPIRPPRNLNRLRVLAIAVVLGALALFYFTGMHEYLSWESIRERRDSWRQVVDINRPAAVIVFLFVSTILMSLSLPVGSVLSIVAGALFDLWLGVGVIAISSNIAAVISFMASRHLFRDFVRHWFGRWLAMVDRGVERDGVRYLLMLRLSPVVPFFAVNPILGLTKMTPGTFFLVSAIGMLPSCFLYVMVGTQVMRIKDPSDIVSTELVVLLTLLAVSPLVFGWIMRRMRGDRQPPNVINQPVEDIG